MLAEEAAAFKTAPAHYPCKSGDFPPDCPSITFVGLQLL